MARRHAPIALLLLVNGAAGSAIAVLGTLFYSLAKTKYA